MDLQKSSSINLWKYFFLNPYEELDRHTFWYYSFLKQPDKADEFLPDSKIRIFLYDFLSALTYGEFSAKYRAAKSITRKREGKKSLLDNLNVY